ncbi:MAG TPA: class I SAM-dependent methyltransferase [Casimicrobiaceae bacterium]|nr:class I SAM-dependent methyltransferase [Casimicrobiaceae bacterium]
MIYRREFNALGGDSLAKLARWIRPGSRVLELGAASGYFTEYLKKQRCEVDIVEVEAEAAREAAVHARRTIVADLDQDTWLAELGDERYDVIVCADVIEHLGDGVRLIARLRERLAERGELLLSVPNVAHSAIIANLLDERFEYGGEGLLDPTHVRLYTWRSIDRMLDDAGLHVKEWDCTVVELFDTEFRVRIEAMAPAIREALAARPHACVYQWLVRAGVEPTAVLPSLPDSASTQHIPVRLLCANDEATLSLEQALARRLPIGGGPVRLEWRLPSSAQALRLLLADRIGVIGLRAMEMYEGDLLIWSSSERVQPLRLSTSCIPVGEDRFALVAPDAWIAPVAPRELLARADRVTATVEWSETIAYEGGFSALRSLAAAMQRCVDITMSDRDVITSLTRERNDALTAHVAMLEEARRAVAMRNADVESLEHSVDAYRSENERLEAALNAQERIITHRQSLRWWLSLPMLRAKWWLHKAKAR